MSAISAVTRCGWRRLSQARLLSTPARARESNTSTSWPSLGQAVGEVAAEEARAAGDDDRARAAGERRRLALQRVDLARELDAALGQQPVEQLRLAAGGDQAEVVVALVEVPAFLARLRGWRSW